MPIDFIDFIGTTEVVPFYQAGRLETLGEIFRSLSKPGAKARAYRKNRVLSNIESPNTSGD